jgi:PAS domain S-box-containing protein
MNTKLHALFLEDIPNDVELVKELLYDDGFDVQMDIVDNGPDYVLSLKQHDYDIIFADFTLPGFDGDAALELAKKICPNIPFICISGTIGEDKAVELLKQGATDYILKDRMERVAFATRRALDAVAQLSKFRQKDIELQTNRKLLQTIINNALDVIYIKDIRGKYILVNEAAENAIGKSAFEIIGKDDMYMFSVPEAQMLMDVDKKVIETGVPLTYEESIILADGHTHTFHTIKCPMFDEIGKPTGLFGISRDITERKHMEQSLIEAKEKAEESDRLKTAFLHNISHEIRTPMNAITGFSNFLKEPELATETRNHFIDIINLSCNQLLDIITDIVNIARLETGQEKVIVTDVHINALLKTLYTQFEANARSKNISLTYTYQLSDDKSVVQADQPKLTTILGNLISNALKFTRQGYVRFGYLIKGDNLEFYVEDTGIGIPSEMHDFIFDRFRKVESPISAKFNGTGLGLSISKGYVELLGGNIWLSSQPGRGSSFYFTLPYIQSNHLQYTEIKRI